MNMVNENSGLNVIIIEFILLAVVSYFLISYYKADNVTLDVIFTVYLSWVLGFVGILLLPYDISLSLTNQADGRLAHVWDFVYWYLLTHYYSYLFT